MSQRAKMITLVICVATLLGGYSAYLIYSTYSDGSALEFFREVDQALAEWPKNKGKRLRLHGNVVKGTIQKKKGSLNYRFAIFHGKRWVEVTFRGLVPDTFKDCAEVVAKGKFDNGGKLFRARKITAKCPSKYDEKQRSKGCGETFKAEVVARRQAHASR